MSDRNLPNLAGRMQALSNATRLRILLLLRDGGLCVCQIAAVIDGPASTVSSHLLDLKRAGIVSEHRRGRYVWYALRRYDDVVPWLRLVARQTTSDPQVVDDHARAARLRLVPPEMLVASTGCEATESVPTASTATASPRSPAARRHPAAASAG
jgi:ArsR family transcriptional regulator, arsenate/arsenite/antimonite-responsive transcriptional repressor